MSKEKKVTNSIVNGNNTLNFNGESHSRPARDLKIAFFSAGTINIALAFAGLLYAKYGLNNLEGTLGDELNRPAQTELSAANNKIDEYIKMKIIYEDCKQHNPRPAEAADCDAYRPVYDAGVENAEEIFGREKQFQNKLIERTNHFQKIRFGSFVYGLLNLLPTVYEGNALMRLGLRYRRFKNYKNKNKLK